METPQVEVRPQADPAAVAIADWLRNEDPRGERCARVFRETFDQLYDGQRTGRYRFDQLFKTEKTHFGTLIEINLQREFQFEDGLVLDYRILGHEIDCKYSHSGQWMIPVEAFDQLLLVAQASDEDSAWSVGVVRATEGRRRKGENRDRKTGLNSEGRAAIDWVFRDQAMQPNALLQLPRPVVDEILELESGQQRVNHLLRRAQNMRLSNNIIATVAQQKDYMKRVRSNGGARTALQPEGILILSGDYLQQRYLAGTLGAAVPERGELVSVRVTPSSEITGVPLDKGYWRLASEGDPVVPAPALDNKGSRQAPRAE